MVDSSDYANTGTPTGTTIVANCKRSGCRSFNGTSDNISVGDSAAFILGTENTISAWVLASAAPAANMQIFRKAKAGAEDKQLGWLNSTNKFHYYLHNVFGGAGLSSVTSMTVGQWYLVTGTYDGTTAKKYINGILDNSKAASGNVSDGNGAVKIGYTNVSATLYWSGLIDDVRIYNRALTAQEVHDLYVPGVVLGGFVINGAKINQ